MALGRLPTDCTFLPGSLNLLPFVLCQERACKQICDPLRPLGNHLALAWILLPSHFIQVRLRAFHSMALHIHEHNLSNDAPLHVDLHPEKRKCYWPETSNHFYGVFSKLSGALCYALHLVWPNLHTWTKAQRLLEGNRFVSHRDGHLHLQNAREMEQDGHIWLDILESSDHALHGPRGHLLHLWGQ